MMGACRGDTATRLNPVAGSTHSSWEAARESICDRCSARDSNVERVKQYAAEIRPRSAAVGLTSLRSILLIIAFDTPERSANSPIDHRRASRSSFKRSASRVSRSLTLVAIRLLYKTRRSMQVSRNDDAQDHCVPAERASRDP